MQPSSIKLSIKLTKEQIGAFPVSIESLWFDKIDGYYVLKNIPQFVDDISYDDLVFIKDIGENLYAIEKVVRPSKNSTIWILLKDTDAGRKVIDRISKLGCGVESGALEGYFSINVPEKIDIDDCYALIDEAENLNLLTADYPSIRH